MSRSLILLALVLAACGSDEQDTDETGDTSPPEMASVFPGGTSTWTGTAQVGVNDLGAVLEITRTGGVLEGTTIFDLSGIQMGIGLIGTIDDQSNQFLLVPTDWSSTPPSGLALVGLSGVYDPENNTLTGVVRDTHSWDFNDIEGGPFSGTSTTPADQVELASITAEHVISETEVTFTGTYQCTSVPRPTTLVLARGSDGVLSGTLSFGEGDGTYVGTFGVVAVEDAVGGTITLAPTPWIEEVSEEFNYGNFYLHGTLDGGSLVGTAHVATGGVDCPEDGIQLTAE